MDKNSRLFADLDLRKVLAHREREMLSEIDRYSENRVLNTSVDDLADYFAEKYRIEPVELNVDQLRGEILDEQVDVSQDPSRYVSDRSRPLMRPVTSVIVEVPFTGEEDLFRCVASTRSSAQPRGWVVEPFLKYKLTGNNTDANRTREEIDRWLSDVQRHLGYVENDVDPWNSSLAEKARSHLTMRRDKFLADRDFGASLGIPLKERDDDSGTFVAPEVRRKVQPTPPEPSQGKYRPEPTITDEEYENILSIIEKTAVMLERSPQTFATMGEEQLRDQFLVPLNSHYEGQATGETFNARGKTDILIRSQDRPVFIAECKIWGGPKAFSQAVDQLLGYTTWRDTKLALLVFNRNKGFTEVLQKIPGLLETHASYKRSRNLSSENSFRVVLSQADDLNREVILTVKVFDVPR